MKYTHTKKKSNTFSQYYTYSLVYLFTYLLTYCFWSVMNGKCHCTVLSPQSCHMGEEDRGGEEEEEEEEGGEEPSFEVRQNEMVWGGPRGSRATRESRQTKH